VADHVTAAPDPGRVLLDTIDAREQALAREAGQAQAQIDELTAKVCELNEATSDLQVTRKTLIALAAQDEDQPAAEPAGPSPALPEEPGQSTSPAARAWRMRSAPPITCTLPAVGRSLGPVDRLGQAPGENEVVAEAGEIRYTKASAAAIASYTSAIHGAAGGISCQSIHLLDLALQESRRVAARTEYG
jgi:cell division septum initiation protein DivIVA